jgi:hypothetical protein
MQWACMCLFGGYKIMYLSNNRHNDQHSLKDGLTNWALRILNGDTMRSLTNYESGKHTFNKSNSYMI